MSEAASAAGRWPRRLWVVGMAFAAVFVCYIDRVNISVAIIPMAEDLGWDLETQGRVLSSFFVGYLLLQIVGGRLADRFGGKAVLGGGVVLWSLFTIFTPPAAAAGLTILIVVRILMGMGEAVTFPSIYSIYGRWIPLGERGRAVALVNSGIPMGTVFALLVTPIIVEAFGWEWAFYLFGALGIVWYAVWHFGMTTEPGDHPKVGPKELATIRADAVQGEAPALPWKRTLTLLPVWAIIVAHFCNNWSLYVLLAWLPTYVNKGLGVDYASIGLFAMIPHLVSFAFLNVAGNIADRMIRSGLPVLRVRRICMAIAGVGLGGALLVVGEVTTAWMAIAVMSVGTALGAFVTGGFAVNHMDIAPRHAGTLMGLTNTAGTIPGIIGVSVSGMILQATDSWAIVFQVAAAVTIFGVAFFIAFARAETLID
jgi:ACS family sodium-dependent inorganic phosphate cotransporter